MKMLKSRLYELELEKKQAKEKGIERVISDGVTRYAPMYWLHINR